MTITIPKNKVEREGGVVILSLREYRQLFERATPSYYLKGGAAKRIDALVGAGLREYRAGKTIRASSLSEAMKLYAAKHKRS